ncbi:glycosyltransferase family 2 protein [Pectinatus frisingensis]|uniref:glycosyltransferase family 2 protein n=1 Tax=Pectinatus frisingensis TaxID=865 RepID=UPI0018C75E94|nr:glycosyltransferase [Pectinatus frisingensis]
MLQLSILIPVYNTEKYLKRCIKSILKQKFTDFEIILVDDGSTDSSGRICDGYNDVDSRIHVIHQKNMGLSAARITGLQKSRGKYVAFIDSDDWIEPNVYEKLINVLEKDKTISIVIGGHVIDEINGQVKFPLVKSAIKVYSGWEALEEMFLNRTFTWSLCDKVYRRKLLMDNNIFNEWPHSYGEDTYVNSYVFPNAKKICFLPLYGYHYCMHTESMTHNTFSEKQLVYLDIWENIIRNQGEKNRVIAQRVWNLMLDFGLHAIKKMYQRFEYFYQNIYRTQKILAYYYDIFSINDATTYIWYSRLVIHGKDYLVWEKQSALKIEYFILNQKKKGKRIFIYGAGKIAHELSKFLLIYNIKFDGFLISGVPYMQNIDGKKVDTFNSQKLSRIGILLGMNDDNNAKVIPILEKNNIEYINASKYIFL